jgi:hypothetical protein
MLRLLTCVLVLTNAEAQARNREHPHAAEPPGLEPYRADLAALVPPGAPDGVELVFGPGARRWPEELRADLGERIRAGWPRDESYGPLQSSVGVELRWPLVTAPRGEDVLVPVVEAGRISIEGRLQLAETTGPRRVVVLVDASSSANGVTGAGSEETALAAERRALDHLVDALGSDWLEFGVIAFGENTWSVAEPGTSAAELRESLARFASEHPQGEGRTDAVCALWTAWDWLESTPNGVSREIVVLTDGDTPFSGRFFDCEASHGVKADPAGCEAHRNRQVCPASHHFSRSDGASDVMQLVHLTRHIGDDVKVTPLIFEPERRALAWQQLAERTGGRLVRAPGPEAIDAVLPALVGSRIASVRARNVTTGAESGDLLQADRSHIAGELALAPGANDVELVVDSDRGAAARYRYRIYAAPGELERALAELERKNRALEERAAALEQEARERAAAAREKSLELRPELPPAAPAP